eukprot:c6873_g1_i1.p1 GENE.c6873_g1_i1~~c6873_g1_i1.p1  ORF type:complete len:304 (+),score=54.12 c6873_g1_i1:45-956(+)
MSSFRNAVKRRIHHERPQPRKRQKLGILEHHGDYTQRARAYNEKKAELKRLEEKAAMRNPDEFYYAMQRTKLKNGVHVIDKVNPTLTEDERELLLTQDANYLNLKIQQERKKIARMEASLHLTSAATAGAASDSGSGDGSGGAGDIWSDHGDPDYGQEEYVDKSDGDDGPAHGKGASIPIPKNRHIVFCDDEQEAAAFSPAEFFDTAPELLNRKFNRPRVATIDSAEISQPEAALARKESARAVAETYDELAQRMERLHKLQNVAETVETQRRLKTKGPKPIKVEAAADGKPAVYRWRRERKK